MAGPKIRKYQCSKPTEVAYTCHLSIEAAEAGGLWIHSEFWGILGRPVLSETLSHSHPQKGGEGEG